MSMNSDLMLFMTENMSLEGWYQRGVLKRELALYEQLAEKGMRVNLLSYGKNQERVFIRGLKNFHVIFNRARLTPVTYRRVLPFMAFRWLSRSQIWKTNQIRGADLAVQLNKVFQKKLIVRCGDLASFTAKARGIEGESRVALEKKERNVFENANHIILPSEEIKAHVIRAYDIPDSRITMIPNYVNTKIFKPNENKLKTSAKLKICTIAKNNEKQKNLSLLWKALRGLSNVSVEVIGSIAEDGVVKAEAEACGIPIHFRGVLAQLEVAECLRSSDIYIQPSLYEGSPKSILEAMACALPVIACRVPGVEGLLRTGETGLLCEANPESLREALQVCIANDDFRYGLGQAAYFQILESYTLASVVSQELEVYAHVLGKKTVASSREVSHV